MRKINKKKARIKLNETLNQQLDAMEDTSSLDVFTPKGGTESDFMAAVNEAIEKEDTGEKRKVKIKGFTEGSMKGFSTMGVIFIFALIFFFIYIMWTIMY